MRCRNVAVVVCILHIVGFLGICAVSKWREAADRASCKNNLKQILFADLNYESAFHHFSSATKSETHLPAEKRMSWYIEILPFYTNYPQIYDVTKPWDAEENRPREVEFHLGPANSGELRKISWGKFWLCLCPSNPNKTTPEGFSQTHYIGIAGIGADAISRPLNAPNIGIFGYDREVRREDIKNASSNMLVVIETGLANGPWVASGYSTARGFEPDQLPYIGEGGQFGGFHRDGANAAFLDGSVRFLTLDTGREVLESMCTIAGNEP